MAIPVAESPPVYLIQLLESVFGIMRVVAKSENMSQITILEIDYANTTSRISMTTIDL